MMMRRAMATSGLFLCVALLAPVASAQRPVTEHPGQAIAFNNSRGNCLACHAMPTMPDAEQPGNSGPPLIAMSARFPDKKVLRAQVWDPSVNHPNTFMPPFGKHKVLTEEEIDLVVDFVYGL